MSPSATNARHRPATSLGDDVTTGFGARLRALRQERGLTLRGLADKVGEVSDKGSISITYLSDLERGRLANPTLDVLTSIAKALGLSLNELLGVEETKRSTVYPPALEEFRSMTAFRDSIREGKQRSRTAEKDLEGEWLRVLAGIRVQGRAPKTASDYLFIFETIRRALGLK